MKLVKHNYQTYLMKKIVQIILLGISLTPLNYFAQFFGLLQKVPQQHYLTSLNYPQDDKYRTLNCIPWSTNNPYFYRRVQVLIFNSNYQLIDSANLMTGVLPLQSVPLKKGNRLYWAGYFQDTLIANPNVNQLVVLELDTNYKHIALHKINHAKYYSGVAPVITNIIFLGGRFYINQVYYTGDTSIIYKLNAQFLKIDSVVLKGKVEQIGSVSNQLMLNISNFSLPCIDILGSSVQKLMMDSSYSFTSCFTFSNLGTHNYGPVPQTIKVEQVLGGTSLIPLSKTKTLVVGTMPVFHNFQIPPTFKTGIVNCIISNNNATIKSSVYSSSISNYVYHNRTNAVAIKNNEIITVGSIGFNYQRNIANQTGNSTIFVNKFDTLGNLIWQKEFGGELFYVPMGITFTKDGGCLISGWRYPGKIGSQIPLVESFLLKLDVNGTFGQVGIIEKQYNSVNTIRCFPVPATEEIYFEVPNGNGSTVEIYNMLGQMVMREIDYQNMKAINLITLTKDFYFYKIRTKTENYSGKFIKE